MASSSSRSGASSWARLSWAGLLCVLLLLTTQLFAQTETPKSSPEQLLQKETQSSVETSSQLVGRLIERTQQEALLQATIGTFGLSLMGYSALLDMSGRSVAILQQALLETSNSLSLSTQAFYEQQRLQKLSQAADDKLQKDTESRLAFWQTIGWTAGGAAAGAIAGGFAGGGAGAAEGALIGAGLGFGSRALGKLTGWW